MNKLQVFGVAFVALLVIGLNVIPLRRGAEVIVCYSGGSKGFQPTVMGLPFGYYGYVKGSVPCANLDATDPNAPLTIDNGKGKFNTAAAWFDLIIGGAAVLGTYFAVGYRKAAKSK